MRSANIAKVLAGALAGVWGLAEWHQHSSAAAASGGTPLYYVDPMHPDYKSDKPGTAPDCGMRLEPVYARAAAPDAAPGFSSQLPAGAVSIDGNVQRLAGIRLAPVEKTSATRVIRVAGRVAPEDTMVYRVNSGVDGFIRTTENDAVGARVTLNQKLASYYAPDFVAAASGFLAASERVTGAVAKEGARSIQNYTDRLRNLGMSDVQIKRMADSRQLPESIDIVSPANGFILARNISAGLHFMHGVEFYSIADLSRVWVVAEVPERELPYLRPGSTAQIVADDRNHRMTGHVTDSLPQSQSAGGTVRLRLEVENPAFTLRPEMLVNVELPVRLPPAITVPTDALVDTGSHVRVYVERPNNVFEPREVETGWRFGDSVEVVRGLKPGERVVVAATFLVDSESRLKSPSQASLKSLSTGAAGTNR